jgi:hypothetical protein
LRLLVVRVILRFVRTLANLGDKDEILRRVQSVCANSPRQWGQDVCTPDDLPSGRRLSLVHGRDSSVSRYDASAALMKTVALWAPFRWPQGFKTAPEIDQEIDGTPPTIFEGDVAHLRDLIARFTRKPCDFDWPTHPHFGLLTEKEWMRLAYLHCDHHLRQFGA